MLCDICTKLGADINGPFIEGQVNTKRRKCIPKIEGDFQLLKRIYFWVSHVREGSPFRVCGDNKENPGTISDNKLILEELPHSPFSP
jgi:hypothetical protein